MIGVLFLITHNVPTLLHSSKCCPLCTSSLQIAFVNGHKGGDSRVEVFSFSDILRPASAKQQSVEVYLLLAPLVIMLTQVWRGNRCELFAKWMQNTEQYFGYTILFLLLSFKDLAG